jgi:DNA invertase Pin-like site-specific DNA recombinase
MAVKYGYARVSSNTQDYAAQVEALGFRIEATLFRGVLRDVRF